MHTSVSIPMISRQAVSERKGKGKTKMGKEEDGSLTPRRKHEIKLPLNFVQRDRGDLVPESAYRAFDKPIGYLSSGSPGFGYGDYPTFWPLLSIIVLLLVRGSGPGCRGRQA